MGFLRRVMRQMAVRQNDRTWCQVAVETDLEKTETQSIGTYIGRRQATVAEGMAFRPDERLG